MEVVPKAMREYRSEMRKSRGCGLTVPQFRILASLRLGSSNNRDLAEHQGVSVAAMSRMVHHLCKHGFVERITSASDRRQVEVRLTEEGRGRFEQLRDEARARLRRRLGNLNEEAQNRLADALQTLSLAVEGIVEPGDE